MGECIMTEAELRKVMTDDGQNAMAVEAFNAILAWKDGLKHLEDMYHGRFGGQTGPRYDTGEKLAGAWKRSQRIIGNFAYEMQWF